ncbi:MAG: hypothetical protein Q9216_004661 [Gyalolechia sp. 2 TL-2023]
MATTASDKACSTRGDVLMEQNSQEIGNDTVSTIEDSDIEGDTVSTQQTAATELSQATNIEPLSHAEKLRLRLRVALFKVRTDQTNVPISQLRIPSRGPLGKIVPHKETSQPTLLPAPVLKPAIHSARRVRPPRTFSSSSVRSETSPVRKSSLELSRTPPLPRNRVPSPQSLSGPPDGQDEERFEGDHTYLNSSAVNGYAARNLLSLREERR